MKKTKKLASLFLAMVMAFSCMAMTASAYEESVVQPRIPATYCSYCGKEMTTMATTRNPDGSYTTAYKCYNSGCGKGTASITWR